MKKILQAVLFLALVIVLVGCNFMELVERAADQPTIEERETVAETAPAEVTAEVFDAVNYTKKAISTMPELGPVDWEHTVQIPAVSGSSEAVTAFNQKIYDKYIWIRDNLEAGREDNKLYDLTYTARIKDGVVGIAVNYFVGIQFSEGHGMMEAYYFDARRDRELTAEEYLAAVGMTAEAADARIRATASFQQFLNNYSGMNSHYFRGTFRYGVFDDEGYEAVYYDPDQAYSSDLHLSGSW